MKRVIYIFSTLAILLQAAEVRSQDKLSLQNAIELASRNNAHLKASEIETIRAKEQKDIARSQFLPSVYLSGQASHYFRRTPFFGFGAETTADKIPYGRFGGEDQLGVAVTASQPIFNPQAGPGYQYARLKERATQISRTGTKIETISSVKQTYLQILVLNERLKLQHESIRRNQRVLLDAKSLFLQGKALRVDTLRAYTSVKNQEPELFKLRSEIETAKLRLKTLIGVDSLTDIQLSDSLHIPSTTEFPDESEIYNAAKTNNPELQLVALSNEISGQQVEIANSSRLPVVSAIAQYQLQSQTNDLEYQNAYYPSSSYVGIQLTIPLFNGFSVSSKVRDARLAVQQSEVRSKFAYEDLKARVHNVLSKNKESLERLKTSVSVRETAQLSYDIIQYRYKKGIASRLELTDAEFELSSAQSNYLEAVYDYLSAGIELDQIMGRVE